MKTIWRSLIIASFSFLLFKCNHVTSETELRWMSNPRLKEYIHGDSINYKFLKADSLRFIGEHELALTEYQTLSNKLELSSVEDNYRLNQQIYCQLSLKDTVYVKKRLNQIGKLSYGGVSPDYLLNVGMYLDLSGDTDSSLSILYKAKDLYSTRYGNNHFKHWLSEIQLGKVYRYSTLEYDSVQAIFDRTVNQVRNQNIPIEVGWPAYFHLADINRINRDYVTGLTNVSEFIELITNDKIRFKKIYYEALILRAKLTSNSGESDVALQIFESVLEDLELLNDGKLSVDLLPNIYNEILISATRLKYVNAEVFNEYIEELKKFAQDSPLPSDVNINRLIGRYYSGIKDYERTIEYTEAALSEYIKGVTRRRLWIEAYAILAHAHTQVGNFEEALEYSYLSLTYDTSLQDTDFDWERVFSPELTSVKFKFVSYRRLGDAYSGNYAKSQNISDLQKALKIYQLIDSIALRNTNAIEEEALLNFFGEGFGMYSKAIDAIYHLYQIGHSEYYLDLATYFFERSKNLLMHRELLLNNTEYFPEVPIELRNQEKRLNKEISILKNAGISENSAKLKELLQNQKKHFDYIQNRHPDYYRSKYSQEMADYEEVKRYSDSLKRAVIQFHWGQDYIYVLSIAKDVVFNRVQLNSEILENISAYSKLTGSTKSLFGQDTFQKFKEVSNELFNQLLSFHNTFGEYKEILILPAGAITTIPFESLLITSNKTVEINYKNLDYLINHYEVSYAHSLKTHLSNNRATDFNELSKVIAYSFSEKLNAQSSSSNNELPNSWIEVQKIEQMNANRQSVFRYGASASKRNFVQDIYSGSHIVHIAMHASSSLTNRLENNIEFRHSGGNTNTSFLYGYEFLAENIKTELVVLSSCETGMGKEYQGEGTFSLNRAFVQSGVPNVLSSLWSISDRSSTDIMGGFYLNLFSDMNPSTALRLAKITYINNSDQITSHPYFWAAFNLFRG